MPFLTGLADWCREVTGDVREWPGWQTRGRSGGSDYRTGRPWWIMYHHTASSSSTTEESLAGYHATRSPNAPVCNLDIARDGTVYVIAAGPTNTNGKGRPIHTSRGTVPADSMNSYALGIEFSNNGIGEPWPQIQVDVGFAVIANCQRHLGLQPTDLGTHHEYAPTRKVDPATAAAVQGPWRPRSINSSGTWSADDLRAENAARAAAGPQPEPQPEPESEPEPEPEEEAMTYIARNATTGSLGLVSHGGAGVTFVWIMTAEDAAAYRTIGIPQADVSAAQFDILTGQIRTVDVIGDQAGNV